MRELLAMLVAQEHAENLVVDYLTTKLSPETATTDEKTMMAGLVVMVEVNKLLRSTLLDTLKRHTSADKSQEILH